MGFEKVGQFRLLYLDRKNLLVADEIHQRDTIDHTPVYPREVVHRALEPGASALIIVHNHPSGDTTPSKADIENFWNYAKRQMRKSNGVPKVHFSLFLKECKWRFNNSRPSNQLSKLRQWVK